MDLLASQPVEQFQNVEGASKLLSEIEKFIASNQGLNMGKINKLNALSKKLNNPDIDNKVKEALKRTEEISEMFEKRESRYVNDLHFIPRPDS